MKRSIVPERVATTVEWRTASPQHADHTYFAEVATLETYKYFKQILGANADASALGEARRSLSSALLDCRARGLEVLSLLFASKATYVNGALLRAPRATHEAAQELGRMCARVDATALTLASDLSGAELLALEPSLEAYLRSEGPQPESTRVAFASPPDAVLTRGIELEDLAPEQKVARAVASTTVLLEDLLQGELQGDAHERPPVLSPALKRAAQILTSLSTSHAVSAFGIARKIGAAATPASRAVRAAMLSVAMGRAIDADKNTLARLAQASLLREVGTVRAARRPSAMGIATAPAEGAAATAALNAKTRAGRERTALVFESLALEDAGAELSRAPSLLALIVYCARKYVDLVEATASARPEARAIVAQLLDTRTGELHLPVLRLLAETLRVPLPTSEQRRRLPSLSGGPPSGAGATGDWGAVHEGLIARTPLPHVLVFMLDYRLSGTIVFREPDETVHRVYFHGGAPSLASSTQSSPRIGEILVARGVLATRDVPALVASAQEMGVRFGEYLVGEGRIARKELDAALLAQLTDRVASLADLPGEARYEYVADENLLAHDPGGEEPLKSHALAIIAAAVRNWDDRDRIERALRRVEGETLKLAQRKTASVTKAFAFTPVELDVYARIAAGNARLVSLLQSGAPLVAIETVVSILYMTRHLAVPGEARTPVLEPWTDDDDLSSRRLPLDPSDEDMVERVLGSLVEQRHAEDAVLEGDLEKAEVHASEAAKLNPDEQENRLLMAWLAAQQDPDLLHAAERVALDLLSKDPESEFGLLYYARICRDLGRQGEARRIYGDLLRLYPENVAGMKEKALL